MYTCQASSKQKAFKALVLPACARLHVHCVESSHSEKTLLLWRKFRIVVLIGCVEVGSIPILQHGQSLLVIVAISFIGFHFPSIEVFINNDYV